jgi:hypothetical protein
MISEKNLAECEIAIEYIATTLQLDPKVVVTILEDGINLNTNKSDPKFKYFIDEMKSSFDCL